MAPGIGQPGRKILLPTLTLTTSLATSVHGVDGLLLDDEGTC
jgi:hypothetical protein